AGRRLRETRLACTPVGGADGQRLDEDQGVRKGCSPRCRTCRFTHAIPAGQFVSSRNGLGFCKSEDEGQATALAGFTLDSARQAGSENGWNHKEGLLPHVPTHLWNPAQCERRESEGRAGIVAALEPKSDDGHLYAGALIGKAAGPSKADHDGEGKESVSLTLSGPNWTMKQNH